MFSFQKTLHLHRMLCLVLLFMMKLAMRYVLPYVNLRTPNLTLNIMAEQKNKVLVVILEIIKLVATALLGYFGGNALL